MAKELQVVFRSDDGDHADTSELQRILSLAGMTVQPSNDQATCDSCGSADHHADECTAAGAEHADNANAQLAQETTFADAGDIAGGIAGGALGGWVGGPPGAIAGGALGAAAGTAAGKWLDKKFDMDETDELAEEQAEYDHGDQDVDEEGHEVDPSTYVWNAPKLPQRIVKGMQGDNPLISELHSTIVEKYKAFLTEDESRENEAGLLSPLSDPTKPEFDKDPFSGETPVSDGSHSPMSSIGRQDALK